MDKFKFGFWRSFLGGGRGRLLSFSWEVVVVLKFGATCADKGTGLMLDVLVDVT